MEYRTLNLNLLSAKGLKKPRFTGRMDVYAVVSISGNVQKQRTSIAKNGNSDPTWNFPMKFVIDEAAGLQNRLMLVIKIKSVGIFGGKNLGEVCVPVKELLDGVRSGGNAMQNVSYQVRRSSSGKPKGVLSFSYEFGEKFTGRPQEPVTAYPPLPYVATGRYGYQQQQPGYGYYPPPVVQPPRNRMNNSGMGFGTGLLGGVLGGMLLGEIVSGGGGCGGGGCGGGGCGGGGGGG